MSAGLWTEHLLDIVEPDSSEGQLLQVLLAPPAAPDGPEEWRPVPDWPGYEASSHGRVRSSLGPGAGPVILKQHKAASGHLGVNLRDRELNANRVRRVHQLVLEAFVGPRPEGMVSRHLNGHHEDNRPANLRYGTAVANRLDRRLHEAPARCRRGRHAYTAGTVRLSIVEDAIRFECLECVARKALLEERSRQVREREAERALKQLVPKCRNGHIRTDENTIRSDAGVECRDCRMATEKRYKRRIRAEIKAARLARKAAA